MPVFLDGSSMEAGPVCLFMVLIRAINTHSLIFHRGAHRKLHKNIKRTWGREKAPWKKAMKIKREHSPWISYSRQESTEHIRRTQGLLCKQLLGLYWKLKLWSMQKLEFSLSSNKGLGIEKEIPYSSTRQAFRWLRSWPAYWQKLPETLCKNHPAMRCSWMPDIPELFEIINYVLLKTKKFGGSLLC